MIFPSGLGLALLLASAAADTTAVSSTIGTLQVVPVDYTTYGSKIDHQPLRYDSTSDTVFFLNSTMDATATASKITSANILVNGLLQFPSTTGNSTTDYYLTTNDESGIVSVSTDNTTIAGQYSIKDDYLEYEYHSVFVACYEGKGNYTLVWRGASSAAACDNDWILVYLEPYTANNTKFTATYEPEGYDTSIAATATENTATTTATPNTASSTASSNAARSILTSGLFTLFASLVSLLI